MKTTNQERSLTSCLVLPMLAGWMRAHASLLCVPAMSKRPPLIFLPFIESKQLAVYPLAFAAVLQMLGEARRHNTSLQPAQTNRELARRDTKHLHAILSPRALRGMSAGTSYLATALLRGLPQKKEKKKKRRKNGGEKKIQVTNNPSISEETTFRGGKTRS